MQPIDFLLQLLMGSSVQAPDPNGGQVDFLSLLQAMGGGNQATPSLGGSVVNKGFSSPDALGILGLLAPQPVGSFTPQRFSTPSRTMLAPTRGQDQYTPQRDEPPAIPSLITTQKARAGGKFPTTNEW